MAKLFQQRQDVVALAVIGKTRLAVKQLRHPGGGLDIAWGDRQGDQKAMGADQVQSVGLDPVRLEEVIEPVEGVVIEEWLGGGAFSVGHGHEALNKWALRCLGVASF
ncbi:hypothetical protein HHA01_02300 [Halomonas halmophila]|uniref:Uncharacterized protein n=1 Tax=Halomonas halmophila TaxID=252 RepID=A0A4Y4EVT6_9GAMM|nr:hypothetical protein HHA01_02300 [Halomonas halmophila]